MTQADSKNAALMKEALLKIRQLRAQLDAIEQDKSAPIAVIGMGCRFAGGCDSPQAFFRRLCEGVDTITEVPEERWSLDRYFDPDLDAVGKMYTRYGGFLDRVDGFDAEFFGISAREAITLDPQQRLLLELAWEALEDAGIVANNLRGRRVATYVSGMNLDYSQLSDDPGIIDIHTSTGNIASVAAGRLAYFLGLHGPALTVDTSCSSSLVAVHLACQNLRLKECELAFSGGVNLMLSPIPTIIECRTRMLSPDGRCKTFDESANGFVRGEGGGMMLLKRLDDALADGDRVLAVIRGSAVNHDGRSSGLSVPNGRAQEAVIRAALEDARKTPDEIAYVEAHGTGTSLGDPIEVGALGAVFKMDRKADSPLMIGSVKTNLGHLEGAAGIAGMIKTVLALHNGKIPPHIHLKKPNPHIAWDDLPVCVPQTVQRWPRGQQAAAGVSSFGFSGTNAHVVLEEGPEPAAVESLRVAEEALLVLSAKNEAALQAQAQRYADDLAAREAHELGDVCYSAATGRSHFDHRLSVIAGNTEELVTRLRAVAQGQLPDGVSRGLADADGELAFVFTGQGSQYAGMGRELYEKEAVFRSVVDRCDACLADLLPRSLREVMFEETGLLDETQYTQPALYALEAGLAALWQSWGIRPTRVLGHSVGEYVAAHVAGVFDLETGLRLLAARARLMQALPAGGEMVAARLSAQEAEALLAGESRVSLAALNGPKSVVLSGDAKDLARLCAALSERGVGYQRLTVSHAFHSPLMEPMLEAFAAQAEAMSYRAPVLPLVSNVSGELAGAEVAEAAYWVKHVRAPVRFATGVASLLAASVTRCVEIGPKPILLGMLRDCVPAEALRGVASLRPGESDRMVMLTALGQLYADGASVDWRSLYADADCRRISLPTYPFQRKRYWIKTSSPGRQNEKGSLQSQQHQPDDGQPPLQTLQDCLYTLQWRRSEIVAAADTGERSGFWILLSGDGSLGVSLEALLETHGQTCVSVRSGQAFQHCSATGWTIDVSNPEDFVRLITDSRREYGGQLLGVINLRPADQSSEDSAALPSLADNKLYETRCLLYLAQALGRTHIIPPHGIRVVTRGAAPLDEPCDPMQAPLYGLGHTLSQEYPGLWAGVIDLPRDTAPAEAEFVRSQITSADGEQLVALREGAQFVCRLVPGGVSEGQRSLTIDKSASYLITGGLGGLGMQLAQWLAGQGAGHLVLLSRRLPSKEHSAAIDALRQQYGVQVTVEQGDVADGESMSQLIQHIAATDYPLRGVVHAAGVLHDASIDKLDWDAFEEVMRPKVQGVMCLHELTRDLPLDFFALFSSAAAVFGSRGQANYAAANAFMDAFAHFRRAQSLPCISIDWGPWSEVGMVAALDVEQRSAGALQAVGAFDSAAALALLSHLLAGDEAQAVAIRVNWEMLSERWSQQTMPLLAELLKPSSALRENSRHPSRQLEQLKEKHGDKQLTSIGLYLKELIRNTFHSDAGVLADDVDLIAMGMDSLMLMELLDGIKRDLDLMIYPREVYERPQLDKLAAYLQVEFVRAHCGGVDAEQGSGESTSLAGNIVVLDGARQVGDEPSHISNVPNTALLLSAPRSGSTLLRAMLSANPSLFSPPELHLLPYRTMDERRAALSGSYLEEGLYRALMELRGMDERSSKAFVDTLVAKDKPIAEVYALLQSWCNKRLLIDKSPSYAADIANLKRAEAIFDNARYIHLVRHPVSMVESFVRMRMDRLVVADNADPYCLAEQIWLANNRNTDEFMHQLPAQRVHRVNFEDLLKSPRTVLEALCDFLGVEFDVAMLQPYEQGKMLDGIHQGSLGIGDPNFREHGRLETRKADAWKDIELPMVFGRDTVRLADRYGYRLDKSDHPAEVADKAPDIDMREEFVDVRGLRLCLCSWGEPDRPPVLLLHGILDQGAAWEPVALELVQAGYYVVAPDLRGHGRSEAVGAGSSYQLMDFLADINQIIEHHVPRGATLVGHSMGSVLAAMYAAVHPEKIHALVLVETVLPLSGKSGSGVEQIATALRYLNETPATPVFEDRARALEHLCRMTPALSETLAAKLADRILQPCEGGFRWAWDQRLASRAGIAFGAVDGDRDTYLDLLRSIRVPLQVVWGESSRFNRPQDFDALKSALSTGGHSLLKGGHQLHIDAAGDLAGEIDAATRAAQQQRCSTGGIS